MRPEPEELPPGIDAAELLSRKTDDSDDKNEGEESFEEFAKSYKEGFETLDGRGAASEAGERRQTLQVGKAPVAATGQPAAAVGAHHAHAHAYGASAAYGYPAHPGYAAYAQQQVRGAVWTRHSCSMVSIGVQKWRVLRIDSCPYLPSASRCTLYAVLFYQDQHY